jgi:hypothetical protein
MKIYSNVIHLSGRFIYLDDFAGNQSVWINEARLYMNWVTGALNKQCYLPQERENRCQLGYSDQYGTKDVLLL